MDLEIISSMKVDELKNFLRLRGLRVTGRKNELVARVFVALENNVPIVKTAVEAEKELSVCYRDKLKLEDSSFLPDPFKVENGWLKEEELQEGIRYWPPT